MLIFKILWSNKQHAESIANYTQNIFSGYGTFFVNKSTRDYEIHCFCELSRDLCLEIAKKISLCNATICDLNNKLYNF